MPASRATWSTHANTMGDPVLATGDSHGSTFIRFASSQTVCPRPLKK